MSWLPLVLTWSMFWRSLTFPLIPRQCVQLRPGRDPPYYRRALMYFHDGKIITNFSRRCLVGHETTGSARTSGIPRLAKAQAEALDALHAIGLRHEVKTAVKLGDIRFINNMAECTVGALLKTS
ncbi:hypothetical protein B0T22DRAFT_536910 [Podospora appendiculata]|uniref:Uncharacterized protein n=1 Tax=Podospora appendiculata TaxID=314037 RepID=A0AAE0XCT3_9PEZI|nr:hypothetical protein B0T22DRAFT_536910 [Podospora appendiculata]